MGHWHIDQTIASAAIVGFATRENDRVLDHEHQGLAESHQRSASASSWLDQGFGVV